jgi:hypothetical protein
MQPYVYNATSEIMVSYDDAKSFGWFCGLYLYPDARSNVLSQLRRVLSSGTLDFAALPCGKQEETSTTRSQTPSATALALTIALQTLIWRNGTIIMMTKLSFFALVCALCAQARLEGLIRCSDMHPLICCYSTVTLFYAHTLPTRSPLRWYAQILARTEE